jgi:alpha-L-rhamnosidase
MKAFMEWLQATSKDHIVTANLADWIEPAAFSDAKKAPNDLVGTASYKYFAGLMEKIANVLGKPDDANAFAQLAQTIKDKYNDRFFDSSSGCYDKESQQAQLFPLAFGMVPEGKEKNVEQQLIRIIQTKYNNHLNTGFVATPILFSLLTDLGHGELAYTMATQEDHPGWFYMLRNGATTIWEVWDAIAQNDHSRNHPAFGSIGAWYFRSLAGIQPDIKGPGFKKTIIKPEAVGDLEWAEASYNSSHGKISSRWERENGKFRLNLIVPVNTRATVYLPAKDIESIREGGKPASAFTDIMYIQHANDRYVFEVGSGKYQFESQL